MYGMISTVFKNEQRNGVPLWHSMLRIQHCHYRGRNATGIAKIKGIS